MVQRYEAAPQALETRSLDLVSELLEKVLEEERALETATRLEAQAPSVAFAKAFLHRLVPSTFVGVSGCRFRGLVYEPKNSLESSAPPYLISSPSPTFGVLGVNQRAE